MSEPAESPPETSAAGAARRSRRRRRLLTQEGVGFAALILSLSLASVGVFQAIRGPDIAIALPLRELYLYRDAGPHSAALSMAARVPLVNRAGADYGDVVTEVTATISAPGQSRGAEFVYQSVVEPVFTDRDPAGLTASCDVRVRCVAEQGFIAIERLGQLVDVPGGSARDQHFGFVLDAAYCTGIPGCVAYTDFERAVAALATARRRVTIALRFSGRRHRGVTCDIELTPRRADYLRRRGWVTLPCL